MNASGTTSMSLIMLVVIIVIMYFLLIRPQKKREKQVNAMRSNLQIGDEVITIGGICGKIVKLKDDSLIIQVGAEKTRFEIMRWGISKVTVGSGAAPSNITAKEALDRRRGINTENKEEESEEKKVARPKKMMKKSETAPAEAVEEIAPVEAPVETPVEETQVDEQ